MDNYARRNPPMDFINDTTKRKKRGPRVDKYQVNHARTSGGPKFTSITEALHYIRHCMADCDNDTMIISKIR